MLSLHNVNVIVGNSWLFKTFVNQYRPSSITHYVTKGRVCSDNMITYPWMFSTKVKYQNYIESYILKVVQLLIGSIYLSKIKWGVRNYWMVKITRTIVPILLANLKQRSYKNSWCALFILQMMLYIRTLLIREIEISPASKRILVDCVKLRLLSCVRLCAKVLF